MEDKTIDQTKGWCLLRIFPEISPGSLPEETQDVCVKEGNALNPSDWDLRNTPRDPRMGLVAGNGVLISKGEECRDEELISLNGREEKGNDSHFKS